MKKVGGSRTVGAKPAVQPAPLAPAAPPAANAKSQPPKGGFSMPAKPGPDKPKDGE